MLATKIEKSEELRSKTSLKNMYEGKKEKLEIQKTRDKANYYIVN
jgi:hypothetical protein